MGLVDIVRSKMYGWFFGAQNPVSTQWAYDAILQQIPEGATILDIGCGDGIYFQNASAIATIKQKKFKIFAIDIDAGAVEICKERITAAGLSDLVSAKAIDVTEITDKYDYVLWMESFPVIPREIFPPLFKHSLTLVNKKAMLYHNLVPDEEATWFWRVSKPLLNYITLVDFGKLTTLTEMRQCMQEMTTCSFTMKPLLSCTLSEMHACGWLVTSVLNCFKAKSGDRKIVQYLLEVDPSS
mmetsp:Transcript_33414/g.68350  ORF Transcript_33414/g.68350 Transcript_33414/m.68350 type:complete len:240 (+) Transcript_33414:60-779(+)